MEFTSPFDSSSMKMRPEYSMKIQNQICSDIVIAYMMLLKQQFKVLEWKKLKSVPQG